MCESVCSSMTFHHMHWLTEPPPQSGHRTVSSPQTNSHMLFLGYTLSFAIHPDKQLFSIFSFHECYKNKTTLHIAFWNWLFSCKRVLSRSIQAVGWISGWFFFIAENYSILWMYHSLLLHSSSETYLACFQFESIINRIIYTHMQVFCVCEHKVLWY